MDTIEPKGTVAYDATSASALTLQATAAFTSLSELVIDSDDMYQIAADELKAVKGLQKTVEERRTAITGPINIALKSVNDLFRAPKEYLEKAEAAVKRSMVTWSTEQERLAAVPGARPSAWHKQSVSAWQPSSANSRRRQRRRRAHRPRHTTLRWPRRLLGMLLHRLPHRQRLMPRRRLPAAHRPMPKRRR